MDSIFLFEGEYNKDYYEAIKNILPNGKSIWVTNPTFGNSEKYDLFEYDLRNKTVRPKFVGCAIIGGIICYSLPKYTSKSIMDYDSKHDLIRKIIRIMRYEKRGLMKRDPLFFGCSNDPKNPIPTVEKLYKLYDEYGLYKSFKTEYSYRKGTPQWGRTVSLTRADIIDGTPIYQKVIKKRKYSDNNEITEIQKSILYHLFYECPYGEILDIHPDIDKSKFSFREIHKNDKITTLLKEELNFLYDDAWIEAINLMISIINDEVYVTTRETEDSVSFYGVVDFNNLFEIMVGKAFGNQISIDNSIQSKIKVQYKSNIIPFVNDINSTENTILYWDFNHITTRNRINRMYQNADIAIPDIVIDERDSEDADKGKCIIIDAKYYTVDISEVSGIEKISGLPKDDDIFKQIYYEYIIDNIYKEKNKDVELINCFVIPSYMSDIENASGLFFVSGSVKFKGKEIIKIIQINMDILIDSLSSKNINVKKNRNELFIAI